MLKMSELENILKYKINETQERKENYTSTYGKGLIKGEILAYENILKILKEEG